MGFVPVTRNLGLALAEYMGPDMKASRPRWNGIESLASQNLPVTEVMAATKEMGKPQLSYRVARKLQVDTNAQTKV